jgi:uncharacterized protein
VGVDLLSRQQADGRIHGDGRRAGHAEGEVLIGRLSVMRPGGLYAALLVAVGLLFSASGAAATPNYPALTGRVVDQANVIPAEQRAAIEGKLKALEDKSGIQLVVATVSSLEGEEIEPYANELFRDWKLGQDKKNNGVLFLIAPKEHKVRIEVGYGLEGTLTDAISKIIIINAVAPHFKTGDFGGGISRGVDDIITTLTTDSADWQKPPQVRTEDSSTWLNVLVPLLFLAIFIFIFIGMVRSQGGVGSALLYLLVNVLLSGGGGRGGGGSSFGGGGGGFSGGGGSSGGGGASGSW